MSSACIHWTWGDAHGQQDGGGWYECWATQSDVQLQNCRKEACTRCKDVLTSTKGLHVGLGVRLSESCLRWEFWGCSCQNHRLVQPNMDFTTCKFQPKFYKGTNSEDSPFLVTASHQDLCSAVPTHQLSPAPHPAAHWFRI